MIDITVCIIDTGFFVPLAERVSREARKTYYFCNWENGYPHFRDYAIGQGIKDVECIDTIGEALQLMEEIDLFIFPDCYYGSLASWLRSKDKLVWGMGDTTWMEQDRVLLKEWMEKEKMPLPDWNLSTGVTELKENLKDDKFIKISQFRGDMETLKHYNQTTSKQFFDEISVVFGGGKDLIEFMDEEKVDGIESGYDMWTVDGKFPSKGLIGYEIKDQVYVGVITDTESFPKPLKYINDKLSKVFAEEKSRGFFSTEVRIDKKKNPFLIDMTTRAGNPPYQLYLEMIDNLVEVMYEGAKGNIIEPIFNSKYGAIAIIESEFAESNWIPIQIEDDSKRWTKIS